MIGLLVCALAISPAAFGEILIHFNIPNTGAAGNITYDGSAGGVMTGTGITVASVVGQNTPSNSGSFGCSACVLSFATGSNSMASASFWQFGAGPSTTFSVTGAVPAAGIVSPTTLLSGYFDGAAVSVVGAGTFRVATSAIIDTKNSYLVDFLMGSGYSAAYSNVFSGNYVQQFTAGPALSGLATSFASRTMLDGQVSNVVPEPGSVLLFATIASALGIGVISRRRRRASH